MFLKQNKRTKLMITFMVICLILEFSNFFAPNFANASEKSVTIKVDGIVKRTFTLDELESKKGTDTWVGPRIYSTINTYPTKKWYTAEGVKLRALLEDAGIDLNSQNICQMNVKASDGYQMTFTKRELLDDIRYYFPGLKDNHEYYGHVIGSTDGKEPVDAIIALKSADSDNFSHMTSQGCPLLIFGQRWITEQTNQNFPKDVLEIDLLTTASKKWASPVAAPIEGTVPIGTKVVLTSEFNDTDKVYYTTDNSDPTIQSPIYNWVAKRWWNNRKSVLDEINKPIEITEDTIIKAKTIGFGREDSDVAVFEYRVEAEATDGVEQTILTWTGDPMTTQTITWLMPYNSSAKVQYLKALEFGGSFEFAQQLKAKGAVFDVESNLFRYTVDITDLTPGIKYVYRVGGGGVWSEPTVFTTATETRDFSFIYMGDVQSEYAKWGNMLNSVYEAHPEIKFGLLGGDLTDKGHDISEWQKFLNGATGVFSQIPVMPTMGNHDGSMYERFFELPGNGPSGLKQEFYSFDYGNAHFVILNSNNNTNVVAKEWLQGDLAATDKKWKFAVFHHPAYPAIIDYKGIDRSIRENWVPILEQHGVDMVFVGHQHVYMRTHPIYQDEVKTGSYGIVYVMGNAGTKVYSSGSDSPYIACEKACSNYQIVNVKNDILTLISKTAKGELIETFTIDKTAQERSEKPKYTLKLKEDPPYIMEATDDDIQTLTVNPKQTGLKHLIISIEPIIEHEGKETVVFTQYRDGVQIQLHTVVADFDLVKTAEMGFEVEDGDIIKIYIVDELENTYISNPIIFQ